MRSQGWEASLMKIWVKSDLGQENSGNKCPGLVMFEALKRSQRHSRKERDAGNIWRVLKAQVLHSLE